MDLLITSLRGGMNNTDPAIALQDDQCRLAENAEWFESMLGERRLGTDGITLPSFITDEDDVSFLHRHLPTQVESAAQLWALGLTDGVSCALGYKDTAWHQVTISDTPDKTSYYPYRWQAVSLHGKLFFAYKSNKNRLHVWDGTTMRRVGLDAPVAPTAADTATGGAFVGDRFYRVRFTVQSAGVTLLRSEPSAVLTKAPSGANTGLIVTKPASLGEGETHWELEASTEEDGDYYVLATTAVATTTVDDTTDYDLGYSDVGDLSEDVGDYTLIPSWRYMVADEDRLVGGGSYEEDDKASQVGWTPVLEAEGVGDDERMELDTDPTLNLDTTAFGAITGISSPVLGGIWVFKEQAIYKLTRNNNRAKAYAQDKYAENIGAIHGSVCVGVDEVGAACVYFIDREAGPCRIGIGGLKRCGEDLRKTWSLLNLDATKVTCSALFYPHKKQMYWNLPTSGANVPNVRIVLHTDKSRTFDDGIRKGWAVWTGTIAKAYAMCLFADNIESGAARSKTLVPFIGLPALGQVHLCDTGDDDNGVAYDGTILSKPYILKSILHKFQIRAAALMAKADSDATVNVECIRDLGVEITKTIEDVAFVASAAGEEEVIKFLDNFRGQSMRTAQIRFTDSDTPSGQWQLNRFDVLEETGEKA